MNRSDEHMIQIMLLKSFKKICISLLAVGLVVLFIGHQAWSEEGKDLLTIDKALELASVNNPILSAAQQQIRQSEEQLNQAKAPLYPSLGAEFIYQKSGEEPLLPVYGTDGSYLGNAVNGFEDTYQAALNFTYLLYTGGAVKYNVQAKDLALGAVKAQAERTSQSVDNGVYSAYYGLQRARARLVVAEEALKLAREHLREVTLFFENGVIAKNQVLRVQVEVSDSELNLIKASNSVDVAWSALERTIGVNLKGKYSLPEPESSVDSFAVPDELQVRAFDNRPELKALEQSRLSALALSKAAIGQGGPQVVLRGETYVVDEEFFPDLQDDWTVSIVASWNFYDGGENRAKVAEAKAAADELLYRIEDLKKQIDLELSTAILNIRSSSQRVSVAKDQVKSAGEDYRMALRRYRAQVGTNIDVLDSRVALINARNQMVDSVYDVFQARADLLFALGMDDYPVQE